MKPLTGEREFKIQHVILLVISMGIMVTLMAFIPQLAILVLFIGAYLFVLFLFTYILIERWYLAIIPPIIFAGLYLYAWNLVFANVFAVIFSVFISLYIGSLFSWNTILVFACLLTFMDVIQVFGTGFMAEAANKFLSLQLPVLIIVPTFPTIGQIGLGLGDIFLAGLLTIQTMQKYNNKAGIISAASIGFAFFLFEIALFQYQFAQYFPATIVVVSGWLLGVALFLLSTRAHGFVTFIT